MFMARRVVLGMSVEPDIAARITKVAHAKLGTFRDSSFHRKAAGMFDLLHSGLLAAVVCTLDHNLIKFGLRYC
jgi:hypothetical protein